MKYIPYGKQNITEEDIDAVVDVLKSDYITQGAKIEEFEQQIARYVGSQYAVAFSSGTAALHASYFSLGLSQGDEFITSPLTFVATSNAGLYLGARPIFCDVENITGNINPDYIEQKITKKTKIIVPIHYAGNPAHLEQIYEIAQRNNISIVEDGAHALGATYKGNKIGSCEFSDISIFSFHPVKHITTGEGGAATTNNKKLYNRMRLFRSHGKTKEKDTFQKKNEGPWYFEMHALGYNYRMTDFQAALGISQLSKIDGFIQKRREIAQKYNDAFKDCKYFDIITESKFGKSAYHLYPILLKKIYMHKKKELFNELQKKNIGVQVHYLPINREPYYEDIGYDYEETPQAKHFYEREISIPIFPAMEENQIEYVTKTIKSIF